ncbi:uncharacterized protein K460DRAFT_364138 [Cucurbitaria berberidis CBS 394.84]|uniref:Uncharacterized protein n=1 Tax=Cucurbitaria berberidis CBS 394.84 TaxID=1168544 RepID=A0A9P4GMH5_9PLEO|nr:uncharacterized protein K460DRAFT_364138 [Cucurbitaria berberidis CBS 394.84]KAF1848159.1 hypothetical protein K460DRAFT_364138 [Cucurbitaria berberidis CBS 394.84]
MDMPIRPGLHDAGLMAPDITPGIYLFNAFGIFAESASTLLAALKDLDDYERYSV